MGRELVQPLVRYLEYVASQAGEDIVVLLLPEYVPRHWWEKYLYNENARRIRDALLGHDNIVIATVPFRRDEQPNVADLNDQEARR